MEANKKESKAQAVRNYFLEHPRAKPREVEKALDSQGIKASAKYISDIKSRRVKSKVRKEQKKTKEDKLVPAKGHPWTFSKNTLEDAIRIPKAIEEKNAGNPMEASLLARAVGFKQSSITFH
jgi:hypothetical protein